MCTEGDGAAFCLSCGPHSPAISSQARRSRSSSRRRPKRAAAQRFTRVKRSCESRQKMPSVTLSSRASICRRLLSLSRVTGRCCANAAAVARLRLARPSQAAKPQKAS